MEKFLNPMFLFDTMFVFGFGILCCLYALWDLRKENRLAEARNASLLVTPANILQLSTDHLMSDQLPQGVRKQNWDDLPIEELMPLIGRRLIYSEKMMLAHVYLKKGAIVPAHDHINEQFTYVLSGTLRFWLGEHADAPGDVYTDVGAGDVLVIPSNVRHRAEALEDTLDVDIFNPPRQDWIDKTDDYLRGTR
ncbi:cupin domain-containing protein [Gemmatimonas sp.]|uniref:cupin domain-containing protein n=1 Tax=Gemmatimonas sp. TaxID=1962908 RepID=UPI00286A41F8|nr:cupin domain-containing protein [Gemmatimonas sp.]